MINHARTLLLNVPATKANYADSGTDGYEFISPDFRPVVVPETLMTIRRTLFGRNPDMLFMGLRAQELLTYVHQSEFADYLRDFDTRVTYWPEILKKRSDARAKKIIITQTYGSPRRLIVNGPVESNDRLGLSYRSYSVHIGKQSAESNDFFLVSRLLQPPFTKNTVPFVVGDLQPVLFPETNVTAVSSDVELAAPTGRIATEVDNTLITENFNGFDELALEAPIGLNIGDLYDVIARWYVIFRAYPQPAIVTTLNELQKLGEPPFIELFGVDPQEPFSTFKNLWFDHPLAVYKMIGLTLGLIYRTEALRNGQ